MTNDLDQAGSDPDSDRVIAEAIKQYEVYREFNELASILDYSVPEEDYQRDINHPLNIHLNG